MILKNRGLYLGIKISLPCLIQIHILKTYDELLSFYLANVSKLQACVLF